MSDLYDEVVLIVPALNTQHGLGLRLDRRSGHVRLFDFYDGDTLIAACVSAGDIRGMLRAIEYILSR